MPEGSLDQMNRRTAVERVGGVGVSHPVRRDLLFQAGPPAGGVDDAAELGHVERSAALAAPEDGIYQELELPRRRPIVGGRGPPQHLPPF